MLRPAILGVVLCAMAGCGDPLAGVDRIDEVELGQEGAPAALPDAQEIAREGFFGTDAASGEAAEPAATPARRGGLRGLFRQVPAQEQAPAADLTEEATAPAQDQAIGAAAPDDVPAAKPTRRAGLFGLLRGGTDERPASEPDNPAETVPAEDVQVASLEAPAATLPQPERRGLFSQRAKPNTAQPRTGPDAHEVSYGTQLPFGEVARVCEAKGKPLGQKVEKATARGYSLHDSQPGATGMRTYYITGFADGCPRQLTAANVLLGSVSLYEVLHYGPGGEHLPKAETDRAYEELKRRICRVGRGKPCGAGLRRMEKNTFFVSAYPSFGDAKSWKELLIHDGSVLASTVKSNG